MSEAECIGVAVRVCSLLLGSPLKCESTAQLEDGRFECVIAERADRSKTKVWRFTLDDLAEMERYDKEINGGPK
jgi:hypothetical protein